MTKRCGRQMNFEEDVAAPARIGVLPPFRLLSHIAHTRRSWPIVRILSVSWCWLITLPKQTEVFQLMRTPACRGLQQLNPRLPLKYLTNNYLFHGVGFTVAKRVDCFLHHFGLLQRVFTADFLSRLIRKDIVLLEMQEENHIFRVTLGMAAAGDQEGEMSLRLLVDGERVFIYSFTVVPGKVLGYAQPDVILLGRIQGEEGRFSAIDLATKAMHHVDPRALLISALQGFAEALQIRLLAGVSAEMQICYSKEFEAHFKNAYEGFYREIRAVRDAQGFFMTALPIEKKQLDQVLSKRRAQTRRQRDFEQKLTEQTCRILRQNLKEAAISPLSPA